MGEIMRKDQIRIKWVDHLPSVNTTDSFLITKHVKRRFVEDLNDFLPIYMERYFWPRALAQIKGKNLIRLFYVLPNRPSTLIYIPNCAIEKIPDTISKQREIAFKYLSDVDSFPFLASKLSGFGRDQFGLNGSPNITELTSWEDYLRFLHIKMGSSFRLVPLRMFSGFIYERSRILWPIAMIKSESSWSTFVARYGYPLGSWCLYQRFPKGKAPVAFRIIRATRWSSFDDITNKDISNIRKKIKGLPSDQNPPFATALNTITKLAINNGNPLNFETVNQRAAQTRSKGRLDGSFSFFHKISSNSSAINYWVTKAQGFYSYEKEDGRQNMHHIGNHFCPVSRKKIGPNRAFCVMVSHCITHLHERRFRPWLTVTQFFINCSGLFLDIVLGLWKKSTAQAERPGNLTAGISLWHSCSCK